MNIEKEIKDIIANAVKELGIESDSIHLEHPAELSHGDFSTNIAMANAKQLGKNPRELAEEIIKKIIEQNSEYIEKVEVAGPGFINIKLSKDFLNSVPEAVLKEKEKFGSNNTNKNKKIIVEYTDPNPFKELHIGHLMSNTIGESISRLYKASGADVVNACYQGDVGLHVAKAVWAMIDDYNSDKDNFDFDDTNVSEAAKRLGQYYAKGANQYEENEKIKEEIDNLNVEIYKIFEKSDEVDQKIKTAYEWGKRVSLEYFKKQYDLLGTDFDEYFFESQVGFKGKDLVLENQEKGVFEESDGAIVYKGENRDKKLHTRVFINNKGLPTYEAKELALAKEKSERLNGYDISVVVTGSEIIAYFNVLMSALGEIYPELAEKTIHMPHGMLRLPSGKMSSRTGNVITAEALINDVKEEVFKKMIDRDFEKKELVINTEKIAVGALKYSILKNAPGNDIVFDFEKSLSFEGDSGPYIQYSFVRANAVIKKAEEQGLKESGIVKAKTYGIEEYLYRFASVVERAQTENSPHYIVTYITELASQFNSFYGKEKVADLDDKNAPYKLKLVKATKQVLENGMNLLGIPVVERM